MSGSNSNSTAYTQLSPELNNIFGYVSGSVQNEIGKSTPLIKDVFRYSPQQIPGLTSTEQGILGNEINALNPFGMTQQGQQGLGMLQGAAGGLDASGLTGLQQNASSALQQQATGPVGSSPLFTAFEATTLPQVLQQANISGLGQGAQGEAITNAAMNAALPIAQLQQGAADQLANLGAAGLNQIQSLSSALSQEGQTGLGNLQTAMSQADLPRQLQAQQFQANYNELGRLAGLIQNAIDVPFGSLAPATNRSVSQGSQSK